MSTDLNEGDVDSAGWNRPNMLDAVLWLVTCINLDYIASAICDNRLYKMQEGKTGFALYALLTKKLPLVFEFL